MGGPSIALNGTELAGMVSKVGVDLSAFQRGTTREKRYLGRIDLQNTTPLLEQAVLPHQPDLFFRILESTHPHEILKPLLFKTQDNIIINYTASGEESVLTIPIKRF